MFKYILRNILGGAFTGLVISLTMIMLVILTEEDNA